MVSLTIIHLCGRVCKVEQRGAAGTQGTLPSSAAFGELEQRKSRLLSNNLISLFSSNNNNKNKSLKTQQFFFLVGVMCVHNICIQF